eukprot:5813392-Pyramimonas_sp.AAC.1
MGSYRASPVPLDGWLPERCLLVPFAFSPGEAVWLVLCCVVSCLRRLFLMNGEAAAKELAEQFHVPQTAVAEVGAFPGSVGGFPGSVGAFPGSVGGLPGSVGAFPGSVDGFPGSVGAFPGSVGGLPADGGYGFRYGLVEAARLVTIRRIREAQRNHPTAVVAAGAGGVRTRGGCPAGAAVPGARRHGPRQPRRHLG